MIACAEKVYKNNPILPSPDKIKSCVEQSFEKVGDMKSENYLLNKDSAEKASLGIFLHPSVTINNYTYRGNLGGKDIFKAVCQTFRHKPEECKTNSDVDILVRTEGSQKDSGIVQRAADKDKDAIKTNKHTIIACLMVAAIILLAL